MDERRDLEGLSALVIEATSGIGRQPPPTTTASRGDMTLLINHTLRVHAVPTLVCGGDGQPLAAGLGCAAAPLVESYQDNRGGYTHVLFRDPQNPR
jgi:hypothetical protein